MKNSGVRYKEISTATMEAPLGVVYICVTVIEIPKFGRVTEITEMHFGHAERLHMFCVIEIQAFHRVYICNIKITQMLPFLPLHAIIAPLRPSNALHH